MIKRILMALILVIAGGILVAWLTQSMWLPGWNQELSEKSAQYRKMGLELGDRSDQKVCFEEALTRFDQCSGFACTVSHGIFLKACWERAEITPGFCQGVPEFRDKPTEDDKSWARHSCWGRDIRGDGCRLLMRQQQQLCTNIAVEQGAEPDNQ